MKRLGTRKLMIIALVIDAILLGILIFPGILPTTPGIDMQISEASIQRICELSTLDCFYHNVTEWKNEGGFLQPGKKLWLEYDGVVRVGVKADQIKVSEPDSKGNVTVTMPEAIILGNNLDENSIREIDSELPLWGFLPIYDSVNTEERKEALASAQTDMVATAENNSMILTEARERAKTIIRKNIESIGEANGKQYHVVFVSASDEQAASSVNE